MAVRDIEQNRVIKSGQFEESTLKIAATAHAYHVLSNSLYSDKILAVLREICTNAYDSHVAAGKPNTPYDVQLPTRFAPTFKVRDYGIGMNHQDVINTYSTYFESGVYKLKSNSFVGCMGLGSKSPLCYTKSFTTVAYHNGMKRTYATFINEHQIPTVSLLSEEETLEPNGVEISMPVNISDVPKFAETANRLFTYFRLKPNITGYDLTINKVTYNKQGKSAKWKLRNTNSYNYYATNQINVIIGDIPYTLNTSLLKVSSVIKLPIDLFFEVGEINVTPNREQLQYDSKTIAVLNDLTNEIENELIDDFKSSLNHCKCLWESRLLAHNMMYDSNSSLYNFRNVYQSLNFTKSGNVNLLTQQINLPLELQEAMVESLVFTRGRRRGIKCKPVQTITIKDSVEFYEKDIENGAIARCRRIVERDKSKTVYLLSFKDIDAKNRFCDLVGILPEYIKKASSLPKPIYNRESRATTCKVFKFTPDYSRYNVDCSYWTETDIKVDDGGVCVVLNRFKSRSTIRGVIQDVDPQDLKELVNKLDVLTDNKTVVCGIRKTLESQFRRSRKWTKLDDYIKTKIKDALQSQLLDDYYIWKEYNKLAYAQELEYITRLADICDVEDINILSSIIKKYIATQQKTIKFAALEYLCKQYSITIPQKETTELTLALDAFTKRYPMLRICADNTVCLVPKYNSSLREYALAQYAKTVTV